TDGNLAATKVYVSPVLLLSCRRRCGYGEVAVDSTLVRHQPPLLGIPAIASGSWKERRYHSPKEKGPEGCRAFAFHDEGSAVRDHAESPTATMTVMTGHQARFMIDIAASTSCRAKTSSSMICLGSGKIGSFV